jgi:hypothetical protein
VTIANESMADGFIELSAVGCIDRNGANNTPNGVTQT